jgi:hypothetical protein
MAAIREFSDQSVRSSRALARQTSLPVLGSIPVIITWKDRKRTRYKRAGAVFILLDVLIGAVAGFHFYVMDLDVLWAKILRRFVE